MNAPVTRLPVDVIGPSPRLVRLADVEPEEVQWLWRGRVPLGKLTVIDGDPALGKSTLALTIAAHLSVGRPWPDGAPCDVADTVLLSAEDGLADTVRPRVDAAGGAPERIHALTEVVDHDEDGREFARPPTLRDVDLIEQAITSTRARLLIIDVLMAYLGGRTDSHRDQDVRSVLSPIAALAERRGCAVVLLRHLNKAAGGSPMYRGGGSIGILGACRAGYLVARDPEDDTRCVLASTKSNLAELPGSLSYSLVSAADSHVARVSWGEASSHDAAALLRTPDSDDDRGEHDEAVDWLVAYLAERGGAAAAKDILRSAKTDGIAERTLRRARSRAGVESQRRGFGEGAVWSIDPTHAPLRPHSGHSGQPSEPGTNGRNEAGMQSNTDEENLS